MPAVRIAFSTPSAKLGNSGRLNISNRIIVVQLLHDRQDGGFANPFSAFLTRSLIHIGKIQARSCDRLGQ